MISFWKNRKLNWNFTIFSIWNLFVQLLNVLAFVLFQMGSLNTKYFYIDFHLFLSPRNINNNEFLICILIQKSVLIMMFSAFPFGWVLIRLKRNKTIDFNCNCKFVSAACYGTNCNSLHRIQICFSFLNYILIYLNVAYIDDNFIMNKRISESWFVCLSFTYMTFNVVNIAIWQIVYCQAN